MKSRHITFASSTPTVLFPTPGMPVKTIFFRLSSANTDAFHGPMDRSL
jgi:hypothetical protein